MLGLCNFSIGFVCGSITSKHPPILHRRLGTPLPVQTSYVDGPSLPCIASLGRSILEQMATGRKQRLKESLKEKNEKERESSDPTMGDDLRGGWQDLNLKEFEVNSHVS